MFERKLSLVALSTAVLLMAAAPVLGQEVLYNNGQDGEIGDYQVNFGAIVVNSFTLPNTASITSAALTFYTVDDSNPPLRARWTITTEPFGGAVIGEGFVDLDLLQGPYITHLRFFGWLMGVPIPHITLPAGTYYLQIQDVVTRWDTFSFWAESSGGPSVAYFERIAPRGAGGISEVPSEAFSLSGVWNSGEQRSNQRRNGFGNAVPR